MCKEEVPPDPRLGLGCPLELLGRGSVTGGRGLGVIGSSGESWLQGQTCLTRILALKPAERLQTSHPASPCFLVSSEDGRSDLQRTLGERDEGLPEKQPAPCRCCTVLSLRPRARHQGHTLVPGDER